MKKGLFVFCFLLVNCGIIRAQLPARLFATDTLKIFSGGNMSIWGNFYNAGNNATGGSLVINLNGKITMYGDSFQNISASKIGGTGNFEMTRPRPAPYVSSMQQSIISGGSTVSFPCFSVNTTSYVELKTNDLRIRDSLKFISGHVLLNKNDLIVGNGATGVITGYNQNAFVVTNGNTTDTSKGYLIREQIGAVNTVFPVGQAIGDYTPAQILNNGTTDNFKVRVFDTVYENGYALITLINPSANIRSSQRTWDIREATTGGSNINLTLQYNTSTEASLFSSNRSKSFISHFTGTYPNSGGDTLSNWKWDMFKLSSTSAPVSPGTLTTGSSIGTASMKSRNGITSFSPFSITMWVKQAVPLPIKIISFNANWTNASDAKTEWMIGQPELLKGISLERSFNGADFTALHSFINFNNTSSFSFDDLGVGDHLNSRVYYRLQLIESDGSVSFSDKIMLTKNNLLSSGEISVYPNPGNESLYISCDQIDLSNPIKIQMFTQDGQLVYEKNINESTTTLIREKINTSHLASGLYLISIAGSDFILNKKIIISP